MDQTEFLHQLIGATFFRDQVTARFSGIEGFLQADEGYALFLAAMHGPGVGAIVEIGSFKGRSTCFLAAGAKLGGRERVIAIDHFRGSPEHQAGGSHAIREIIETGSTLGVFKHNLESVGLTDQVEIIVANSIDAAHSWSAKIRLLFIDGDHDYDSTKADFDAFARHLCPNALVCFHDVDGWPGVTRFCRHDLPALGWRQLFRIQSLACFVKS